MPESANRTRWRAILKNAATWAAAWGAAGGAIIAAIALVDPRPAIESLPERLGMALLAGVAWGARFAVAGAVIGAAFAFAIRLHSASASSAPSWAASACRSTSRP
jgi:hypothetical protein